MQELRPTAEWTEVQVPQFVILKIQNTSISTEAKLQVYLGMDKPTNNTFGFFLTPGSSFDTLVGKNKVFVRSDSGATGGFAYSDITNKLTPTTFETEHIVADIANSFTKYIQRAHTIVIQNISDREITLAISNDTAMRDGFVIKPYQFIGMNIAINSNIILYGEGAKASIFVTPSFDANGGINSEMMSVFEKYFGIIEIINGDYVPKAQHKNDLAALNTELVKKITEGLKLKLDVKTFNEFLQSNTESLNGVVPLSKPTQFGPGVTGSENFRDEKFRVELFTTDPAINLDAIDGVLINKINAYDANNNGDYVMTLKGMNAYIDRLNSKYIAIDGGDIQNPLASNIIAGDGLAGSMAVSSPDEIRKSGFYVCQYNLKGIETYGAILHIEDHVNVQTATQIAISGVDSTMSIRVKKVGIWGQWSTLLPSSNFDSDAFLKIIGGNVTGGTRFSGSIHVENISENVSKPYAMSISAPVKPSNKEFVDAIKILSQSLSCNGINIEMSGESSNGVKIKQTGGKSVGIDVDSTSTGAKISSATTGVHISPNASSSEKFIGATVDLTGENYSTGVSVISDEGCTGIKIEKSLPEVTGVGVDNALDTIMRDKVIASSKTIPHSSVSSTYIGTIESNRKTAMILGDTISSFDILSSMEKSILTLSNVGGAKNAACISTNGVDNIGVHIISNGGSRGMLIESSNSGFEALCIKQLSETLPAVKIECNGIAIETNGDINVGGKILASSFSGSLIGKSIFNFESPDVKDANSITCIGITDNDTSNPGKPEEGSGGAIHISGPTLDLYSQMIIMNNKLFFRNEGANFSEAWSTTNLTVEKVDGIRDKTDGAFTVQIESTEDIATSKNVRCRNLISLENVTGFYSDRRLKEDITPIDSALDKIVKLNPVSYKPNDKALEAGVIDRVRLGFIAQEVKEVVPEAVERAPINDVLGTDDYLTVDNNTLIPVMMQAIKELKAEVDELKSKLSERGECKCCQ